MPNESTYRINGWLAMGLGLAGFTGLPLASPAQAVVSIFHANVPALADGNDKGEEPKGDPVALDKIPKAVVDAVKKALPGVRIIKAYVLKDGNYFLDDAKVGKREWDITVTPEGKILKKEQMKDND